MFERILSLFNKNEKNSSKKKLENDFFYLKNQQEEKAKLEVQKQEQKEKNLKVPFSSKGNFYKVAYSYDSLYEPNKEGDFVPKTRFAIIKTDTIENAYTLTDNIAFRNHQYYTGVSGEAIEIDSKQAKEELEKPFILSNIEKETED